MVTRKNNILSVVFLCGFIGCGQDDVVYPDADASVTLDANQEDANQDVNQEDANQKDANQKDVNQKDVNQEDANQKDANQEDANQEDANQEDANQEDTNQEDANQKDSALVDSKQPDAQPSDTTQTDQSLDVMQPDSQPDSTQPDSAQPDMIHQDTTQSDLMPLDGMVADSQISDTSVPDTLQPDSYVPPTKPPGCNIPTNPSPSCSSSGFCSIPSGCFLMGSPPDERCRDSDENHHWVILTRSFEISETEVTSAEFSNLMKYSPTSGCPKCPVLYVTWHEAAAYTNALSTSNNPPLDACYTCTGSEATIKCATKEEYTTGTKTIYECPGYRLPTEAEWEYAYRAGTTTAFYSGSITHCNNKDTVADRTGWYKHNTTEVKEVKQLPPSNPWGSNPWGLYDMAGNAEEWVHDLHAEYPTSAVTDPVTEGGTAADREARGGNWSVFPRDMRGADRNSFNPMPDENLLKVVGFRVARSK